MGNCLVTKLKGVVQNDNLPKYNTIKFRVSTPDDFNPSAGVSYFYTGSTGDGAVITSVTGELFDICNAAGEITQAGVSTWSASSWVNIKPRAGKSYIFEISPKYGFIGFGCNGNELADCLSLDVSDFCWSDGLLEVALGSITNSTRTNIVGNFKLPEGNTVFRNLNLNCCDVYANINDFANLTTLKQCNFFNGFLVEGSIHSLSKSIQLQSLKMTNNKKVTGDLKTLADAMVANGRTSGQIEVQGWNSLLTIDGVAYNTKVKAEGENYWNVDIIFDSSLAAGYRFYYHV